MSTNNNTSSNQHQYMAPVPSVCVRVPHSPSIDSGPCTPLKKLPIDSDFTALAVRECATRVCMQNQKKKCFQNPNLHKKNYKKKPLIAAAMAP